MNLNCYSCGYSSSLKLSVQCISKPDLSFRNKKRYIVFSPQNLGGGGRIDFRAVVFAEKHKTFQKFYRNENFTAKDKKYRLKWKGSDR